MAFLVDQVFVTCCDTRTYEINYCRFCSNIIESSYASKLFLSTLMELPRMFNARGDAFRFRVDMQ